MTRILVRALVCFSLKLNVDMAEVAVKPEDGDDSLSAEAASFEGYMAAHFVSMVSFAVEIDVHQITAGVQLNLSTESIGQAVALRLA